MNFLGLFDEKKREIGNADYSRAAIETKDNGRFATFVKASSVWGKCVSVGVFNDSVGGEPTEFNDFVFPRTIGFEETMKVSMSPAVSLTSFGRETDICSLCGCCCMESKK